MKGLKWSLAAGLAVLAVAAGAACTDGTGSGQPSASASVSATGSASGSASAKPTGASPATTPAGGVTVSTNAVTYAVGETLRVTVRNGRSEPVYTEDFQTGCTIVTLQVSSGGSWTDITGCALGRPTRTVTMEPGAANEILLDPHGFHVAEGADQLGFGAGTYRIRFGYRLGPEPSGAQPLSAYSMEFTVG